MKLLLLMGILLPLLGASVASYTLNPRLNLRFRRRNTNAPQEADTTEDGQTVHQPEEFDVINQTVRWDPYKTAVIVCDMWDRHWCQSASARVEELAPHMNNVLNKARERGMLIIHAPSETMEFYQDAPQRIRVQEAPPADPPETIHTWHGLDPEQEPPLPIDDSDGGCDDVPQCAQGAPWTRQHPAIRIHSEDAITDRGGEVYNLLMRHGVTNVIIMGVHTNMCVLRRPFAIRNLVGMGFKVALMRDMTDTMYNPRRHPEVNHFRGTDLVIEHIEKYCCPTLLSTDLTGQPAFRFTADKDDKDEQKDQKDSDL